MFSDLPPMYWEIVEEGGSPLLSYFSQTPNVEMSRWGFDEVNDEITNMMNMLMGG